MEDATLPKLTLTIGLSHMEYFGNATFKDLGGKWYNQLGINMILSLEFILAFLGKFIPLEVSST